MPKFDYDVTKAPPAFKKAERTTPDRMGNVLILLTFVGGSLVLYIVIFAMICSRHLYLNVAGWFGLGTILIVIILVAVDKDVIRTFEEITGHDWNQDGYIGAPSTHIQFQASDRTTWMATLPAPPELIYEWGKTYLNGGSVGYRQWQHRFALLPDGSDGDRRYAAFRAALVRHELAIEKGKSGISLTERGIQEFTEYVHQNPQGTPLLEG